MSFSIYDASVPIFAQSLKVMPVWLDKALAALPEATLLDARLAPDMAPLTAQFQMASDTAKNAVARLLGVEAPGMPDTEASVADLKERCGKTVAYIEGQAASTFDGAAEREVQLKFPNGMGYRFTGAAFLTGFALPNFFFHVTTAYAILRAAGVPMGKPDFLQHLGAPNLSADD